MKVNSQKYDTLDKLEKNNKLQHYYQDTQNIQAFQKLSKQKDNLKYGELKHNFLNYKHVDFHNYQSFKSQRKASQVPNSLIIEGNPPKIKKFLGKSVSSIMNQGKAKHGVEDLE